MFRPIYLSYMKFCCIGSGERCKALTMLIQEFGDFAPYNKSFSAEAAALLTLDDFRYELYKVFPVHNIKNSHFCEVWEMPNMIPELYRLWKKKKVWYKIKFKL